MQKEIKFEYGFQSQNGIVKKVYDLAQIPRISQICDVWNELPICYVRQSTGFKDENDIEVYEGDIISSNQWNPRDYKVVFEDGEFCFVSLKGVEKPYTNPIHYVENFAVIGNIYENPELFSEQS